jgi:hypothetical protein
MDALKRSEAGIPVTDICRELGIEHARLLPLEVQVWRHGHLPDVQDEGA